MVPKRLSAVIRCVFSSRCTESLVKVFRPWAGAILRTGPPFWRLGRIIRHVLLGHVLAAWLLEHLHGPRCPFLLLLLDYLLGVGFPSLFLWHLLLLGFAVRILRGGDQKTPGNIGRHDWVLRVPGRSWVQLLQGLFRFVCVLISLQSELHMGPKKYGWHNHPNRHQDGTTILTPRWHNHLAAIFRKNKSLIDGTTILLMPIVYIYTGNTT